MNKSPFYEAMKEVLRWVACVVLGWIVAATIAQISKVPEFATFNVYVFSYDVPIRLGLHTALTVLARFLDKFIFEYQKNVRNIEWFPFKGLLPF